jgi:DNA-binding MarR family transcriptional regulator
VEQAKDIRSKELLIGLRKITQAIDLHSKYLSKTYGMTGPQLVLLQELADCESQSISELSKSVALSQGTVTDIVVRLEKKGLLSRRRCESDKRRVLVSITDNGKALIEQAPSALQDKFIKSFHTLEDWEQLMILSSINRIVNMMSAETIEASPFLVSGPIQINGYKPGS